jgi:hypothetical protein
MGKFVVAYLGGGMGDTPEEQEASMNEWMGWFAALGSAVTDVGNPFMGSTAITSDGERTDATSNLTGYSIVEAGSLDDAALLVAKCPILASGGSLELFEALPM